MKLSIGTSPTRAVQRRGGPAARRWLLVLLLPFTSGCLHNWLSHKEEYREAPAEAQDILTHYYQRESGGENPYRTGIALELPDTSNEPLTATNADALKKRDMTLHEALVIAIKNSRVIRQLRNGVATATATVYEPAIAETRIEQELARFDAQLTLNLFWGADKSQLNNNITGSGQIGSAGQIFKQDTFSGRAPGLSGSGDLLSIRKLLAPGTEVTVGFDTNYSLPNIGTRFFRSAFDSKIFGQIRQPLFQGYGVDVNRAPIVIARLRADQSLWEFQKSLAELVRDVEQKYWELYAAQVQLWAQSQAIEINSKIVADVELSVQEGTKNAGDLAEARTQLANLLVVRNAALSGDTVPGSRIAGVQVVERQLRGLLGLKPADGTRIVAVDDPLVAPVSYDYPTVVREAFTFHPDIQRLKLGVAEQQQIVKASANAALPKVDLFARWERSGLGSDFGDSINPITGGEKQGSYVAGVQAQYDFGYRRELAQLQQAELQQQQAKAVLRDKGLEVWSDVCRALQQIDARAAAYKAAVFARQNAEYQLELRYKQFVQSQLELDRLLPAVRGFAEAYSTEVQYRVEFQNAIVDLETAKGTVFRYNSIHVHEGPYAAAAYPQACQQQEARRRAIEWYHPTTCLPPAQEIIRVTDDEHGHSAERLWSQPPAGPAAQYGADITPSGPTELPLELRDEAAIMPTTDSSGTLLRATKENP